MEGKVQELIRGILRIDLPTLLAGYDSTDIWESMQRIEVIFAAEEEFGVRFTEGELAELDTPRKLVRAVLGAVQ